MKEKLIQLVFDYGIIKTNFKQPLTFKSGIRSPIYCDFRMSTSYPKDLMITISNMFEMSLKGKAVDVILGVSEGAISHATALGHYMGKPFGFIRKGATPKDYGLGKLVEGVQVSGNDIVIIEDLVSMAGSMLGNAEIAKQLEAESIILRSIFSYDMKESRKALQQSGLEYESLITIHDVLPYLQEKLPPLDYDNLIDWVDDPEGWFERHKTEFEFGFLTRLRDHALVRKSLVCSGWDPVLASLPEVHREHGIAGYGEFMSDLFLEMNAHRLYPGMFKPNHGFYEIYDAPRQGTYKGSETLNFIMNRATSHLYNVPINLDFKRGDIGKSSANYATVGFDNWQANAVTVHGYMGTDSIEPFTKYCTHAHSKGVYILCKTSNPGSKDFQLKKLQDSKYLYEEVGQAIIRWAKGRPGVGAVIGGTSKEELFVLAKMFAGKDIPILIPGVGAQGGSAKEVAQILREAGFELELARINSSSGLSHPWYSEKNSDKAIPSKTECINMCVNALKELNEEIAYQPATLVV